MDYVTAYSNSEVFDEYITNLEEQVGRKLTEQEKADADEMWHELTYKYSE